MRVSRYIQILEDLMKEHGDLEVEQYFFYRRREAITPQIAYQKILKKRESKPGFWQDWHGESCKGKKVIQV